MENTTPPINGQILKDMQDKLKEALAQPKLSQRDRLQYEIMQLMAWFFVEDHPKIKEMYDGYKTAQADHQKTTRMYAVFVPMAWAFTIIAATVLGGIATGKINVVFAK